MNELALFAGAGGGILAGRLLGWRTIAACEIEPYPRAVLLHNQELGNLPHFPIWDDIRTLDGTPFRGIVDIVTGGFPCQDISCAGKGAGIAGERSGLWAEMHRIICEVRPRYAVVENSPMLTSRGLGRVLGDLAKSGYNAAWTVLGAADCGAPHRRDRIWILAEDSERRDVLSHTELHGSGRRKQQPPCAESSLGTPTSHADSDCLQRPEQRCEHDRSEIPAGRGEDWLESRRDLADAHRTRCAQTPQKRSDRQAGREEPCGFGHVPNADLPGCEQQRWQIPDRAPHPAPQRCSWWSFEPRVGRVADGVASRVDRLKALGNGQVPLVAATAFQILKQRLDNIQS